MHHALSLFAVTSLAGAALASQAPVTWQDPSGHEVRFIEVDDVLHVLDALDLRRAVLGGHSFGGYDVTNLAARHPNRLSGLVYLNSAEDPTLTLADYEVQPPAAEPLPASARREPPPDLRSTGAYRDWQRQAHGVALPEAEVRQLFAIGPGGTLGRYRTPQHVHDARFEGRTKPDYLRITVPALAFVATSSLADQLQRHKPQTGDQRVATEQQVAFARLFAGHLQGEPAFERASVKRVTSQDGGEGRVRFRAGGELEAANMTLRELIAFAYQRHTFDRREVAGGPEWIDAERFDVAAKAGGDHVLDPGGTPRQTLAMMRTLLAKRFGLSLHEEQRERPVYVLTSTTSDGTLGPRMRRSGIHCGAVMGGQRPALPAGQGPPCGFKTPPGRLFANTFTMPAIASLIARHVDRPVIDRTGLTGRFDIELEAAEIEPPPGYEPGPSDLALPPAAGPSIFIAVREQLGLALEARMAPVAVLVVDRAERPVQ